MASPCLFSSLSYDFGDCCSVLKSPDVVALLWVLKCLSVSEQPPEHLSDAQIPAGQSHVCRKQAASPALFCEDELGWHRQEEPPSVLRVDEASHGRRQN